MAQLICAIVKIVTYLAQDIKELSAICCPYLHRNLVTVFRFGADAG